MAAIWTKGGPASPLKMIAESEATLARFPKGMDSSTEKEQDEAEGGTAGIPGSRLRAAARSSARSGMGRAGLPSRWAASRRALRREATTGEEVDLPRRE